VFISRNAEGVFAGMPNHNAVKQGYTQVFRSCRAQYEYETCVYPYQDKLRHDLLYASEELSRLDFQHCLRTRHLAKN